MDKSLREALQAIIGGLGSCSEKTDAILAIPQIAAPQGATAGAGVDLQDAHAARVQELHEIVDGAYGDDPAARGRARAELARLPTQQPRQDEPGAKPVAPAEPSTGPAPVDAPPAGTALVVQAAPSNGWGTTSPVFVAKHPTGPLPWAAPPEPALPPEAAAVAFADPSAADIAWAEGALARLPLEPAGGPDGDVDDSALVPFGWGPGLYVFNCRSCGRGWREHSDVIGAKRSWRCRSCALAAYRASLGRHPSPAGAVASPPADGSRESDQQVLDAPAGSRRSTDAAYQQIGGEVTVPYTNWRDEFALRRIGPIRLFWGSNKWHPEAQWLIEAWDLDTSLVRTFALAGIGHPATDPGKARREALEAEVAWLRSALKPFAEVAEHDVGQDETDTDLYQVMRYNRAPHITVGHLRQARAALTPDTASPTREGGPDHAA